jgi:hypothetical protein
MQSLDVAFQVAELLRPKRMGRQTPSS